MAVNATWSFSVNSLKAGFVEKESPLGLVFNEFLLNEQETTSQVLSQQTKLPDSVLTLPLKAELKLTVTLISRQAVGLKLGYSCQRVCTCLDKLRPQPSAFPAFQTSSEFMTITHLFQAFNCL